MSFENDKIIGVELGAPVYCNGGVKGASSKSNRRRHLVRYIFGFNNRLIVIEKQMA